MKKFWIVLLSLMMFLAMAATAVAYTDTAGCTEAEKTAIDNLSAMGIVDGYPNGEFAPNGNITRAEFAKVAVNSYIQYTGNDSFTEVYYEFKDLVDGAWYTDWIQKACNAGMLIGYEDNTFRPNNNITGNEIVTVLVRTMGYNDQDLQGSWPQNYIDKAKELGLLNNVNINLDKAVSRAQVCLLVNNMFSRSKDADYAIVEKIDSKSVDLLMLNNKTKNYDLKAAGGAAANQLVAYTVNGQNQAELSLNGISTAKDSSARVDDNAVTLNGKSYKLTDDTKVYLVDGKDGDLQVDSASATLIGKGAVIRGVNSSKLNLPMQFVADGDQLKVLVIGGYSTSGAVSFGFIEDMDIHSSRLDNGVKLFGDDTEYEKSAKSDETLAYNTLYQYSVKDNYITLNAVDTAKEQIKAKKIISFGDDLYNTEDDKQFVVTEDTQIIKVVLDKDGEVDEVSYGYELKKGDVVSVRYDVKAEDEQKAAYVIVYDD